MAIELYEHQKKAIGQLKSGAILCGGVGSGKSRTALAYYYIKECGGQLKVNGEGGYSPMRRSKPLYIITTARKRDTLEWDQEMAPFLLSRDISKSTLSTPVVVDSWNNIKKYADVENAFFIFDEQRVVGYGTWSKSFIKIARKNRWILLSATPGDTWSDYAPVFIANGFYRNITEFRTRHVVYDRFAKYPKIKGYINTGILTKHRKDILIFMPVERSVNYHHKVVYVDYNKEMYEDAYKRRWNIFKEKPAKDASEMCYIYRRIVNSDKSRIEAIRNLLGKHDRVIIFYNFDYERFLLRHYLREWKVRTGEWSGHKHDPLPKSKKWVYLVQYTAGSEGWNCTETNAIVFFSQNYSYKIMTQAAGRIDRINTPYKDLYFYHLESKAPIDLGIKRALKNKRNFNEKSFNLTLF